MRAVLGLGSNLGDRLGHLQSVVQRLGRRVVAASKVYETASWGDASQPDYLNAVIVVDDPETSAWEWLRLGQDLENAAGRLRDPANQYAARPLDVDVLASGSPLAHPRLTLPHPRAHLRAFVLIPWLDVEPDALLEAEGHLRELSALVAALDPAEVSAVRATTLQLR